MRILIAGGSGFVGERIIRKFHKEHDFLNISLTNRADQAVNNLLLDLTKPLDFLDLDKPVDMIINCVECHRDLYENDEEMRRAYLAVVKNLIDYAKAKNIRKIIHFSINSIETVENDYHLSKFVSEGLIEHSGIDFVIFKPSIMFGDTSPLDMLVDTILARKILPRFWNKEAKLSPVHISDVLANIAFVIKNQSNDVWDKSYSLCGPDCFSFEEILLKNSNKKLRFVQVPSFANKLFVATSLKGVSPKQIKILLDWVKSDNFCLRAPPLKPQIAY